MLVILIGTILYHARRKLLITEDNNIHKKKQDEDQTSKPRSGRLGFKTTQLLTQY